MSNANNDRYISKKDLHYIEERTRYDAEKIKKFYTTFIETYPHGYVNRDEFKNIFKRLSENESLQNKNENDDSMCDQLFQMCDVDSNGFIDFKEYFVLFWSRIANENLEEKLKFIFDIFDSDKSGYVDFYELHRIVKILFKFKNSDTNEADMVKNMKTSFYKAYKNTTDNNSDNLLTPSYYISFDIMKKFDTSRNGTLSREEFINGCKNHEQIRQFLTPLKLSLK